MESVNHNKSIFSNALKIVTGEGIGKIIGIILTPVIARIYGPADMGVLSLFLTVISILGPFVCLLYTNAIPICKNERIMYNIVCLCLQILVFFVFALSILLLLSSESLFAIFELDVLIPYWFFIPISLAFRGVSDILSTLAVRKHLFNSISKVLWIQKLFGSLLKIVLGSIGIKPIGLLIGEIVTLFGGISIYYRKLSAEMHQYINCISFKRCIFVFYRYSSFPKYRLPSQILLSISGNIPNLYFSIVFGMEMLGNFSMARTMLAIPISVIGSAVSKSFLGELSKIKTKDKNEFYSIVMSIAKKMFILGFLYSSIVYISARLLFTLIFGSQWIQAGIFAQLLSITLLFQMIYSPLEEGVFNVFEKQKYVLLIELIRIIIIGLSLSLAYLFEMPDYLTVLCYSIGLTIQYIIGTIFLYKIIK